MTHHSAHSMVNQIEPVVYSIKPKPMPPKKAKAKTAAGASSQQTKPPPAEIPLTFAETLSIHAHPRPFKNPNPSYLATKTAVNRRTKPLKMLMLAEREREEREALEVARMKAERRSKGETTGDVDGEKMDVDGEDVETERQGDDDSTSDALLDERLICYTTIEAPPSLLPQPKYCDITGLEAPYTDPSTGLRYHDRNIYAHIKSLKPSAIQSYLALRGQLSTI